MSLRLKRGSRCQFTLHTDRTKTFEAYRAMEEKDS